MPKKAALSRSTVSAILAEEVRRYEQWRNSRLRRTLLGLFFVFVALFTGALFYYSLPLGVSGDTTMCSTATTSIVHHGEAPPESVETTVSCERRTIPSWLLVGGSLLLITPIAVHTVLRPGRVKASLKSPGGDDAGADFESTDSLTSILETLQRRASADASNYRGV